LAQVLFEQGLAGELTASYYRDFYGFLVGQERSSGAYWYAFSADGTARSMVTSTSAVADTMHFDAWGVPLRSTGVIPTPYGFVGALGYWSDYPEQLVLLNWRPYCPSVGAFLSRDAIWSSPYRPEWLESYTYSRNNPSGWVDPDGNFPAKCVRDFTRCLCSGIASLGTCVWDCTLTGSTCMLKCYLFCIPCSLTKSPWWCIPCRLCRLGCNIGTAACYKGCAQIYQQEATSCVDALYNCSGIVVP